MLRHRVTAIGGANHGASSGEDSSYEEGDSDGDSYEGDSGDDSSSTVDATRAIDLGEHSAWHNKKITRHAGAPLKNGGLPDYARGLYDLEYWRCTPKEGGSFVSLHDMTHNLEYVLPIGRVNKGMRFLTLPSARELFDHSGTHCHCKKQACYAKPGQDTWAVLRHRI